MSDAIGPVALTRRALYLPGQLEQPPTAQAAAELKRLPEAAAEQAGEILAQRRAELDRLAALLLERETLEGDELRAALREPAVTQA